MSALRRTATGVVVTFRRVALCRLHRLVRLCARNCPLLYEKAISGADSDETRCNLELLVGVPRRTAHEKASSGTEIDENRCNLHAEIRRT